MADPKFDPSNRDHVEALTKRLGLAPLKWTVHEGYGGGFEAVLEVQISDWKYIQQLTYGRKHPLFSEEMRRRDLKRLVVQVTNMLLDDIVPLSAEG